MNILGIDPGTRFAGFSIMNAQGMGKLCLLEAGCLILSDKDLMQTRLHKIFIFFDKLIIQNKIGIIALETPFLGKNAQNFLKLGYVRGIIYLLADIHSIVLKEYAPREIKKAVTGSGSAEKDQVGRVVKVLFPQIVGAKIREDVTDAIAIALCGAWHEGGQHLK